MTPTEIQARVAQLLRVSRDLDVPTNQIYDLANMAQAGEWKIALEMFCDQLYDHDVAISPELLAEIQELGNLVKLDPKYLRPLEELVSVA